MEKEDCRILQRMKQITFEPPFKTGKCSFTGEPIPYIITKDGRGVCYWAKDGGIASLGNTCSDFDELIDENVAKSDLLYVTNPDGTVELVDDIGEIK